MKRYIVIVKEVRVLEVPVEANSSEEAKSKVREIYSRDNYDKDMTEIVVLERGIIEMFKD